MDLPALWFPVFCYILGLGFGVLVYLLDSVI